MCPLPRGGGLGWGKQPIEKSKTYLVSNIVPLPTPPPGPMQNADAFCMGTRPLRASPCSQLCSPDPSIGETKLGFYTLCGSVSSVFSRLAR